MNLDISQETEARLADEARKEGLSVDALLRRLMGEHEESVRTAMDPVPELPILHLGPMDALHRRDIYDDVL